MTKGELEIQLLDIQDKLAIKRKEYFVIGRSITRLYNKETKLKTELFKLSTLTWENVLYEDNSEGMEIYKTKEKFLQNYTERLGLPYLSLRFTGFYPDINQRALKIALYKHRDDITIKIYEGLLPILPYLLLVKYNCSKISIFEETLSEHGSYYILCKKINNKYIAMLCVDRYHRSYFINIIDHRESPFTKVSLFPFFPLLDVFKYIQKNHYYEKDI